jgi:hypothetical protein
MDILHTYVYHIWNEWARGFAPQAVTPWFVREEWLMEDKEIFQEFVNRVGCNSCSNFDGKSCRMATKEKFAKTVVPCKDPDI